MALISNSSSDNRGFEGGDDHFFGGDPAAIDANPGVITANDGALLDESSQDTTVTSQDVLPSDTVTGNTAPTDEVLSANTVVENAANGTEVGTVASSDPDAGDVLTYTLTDDAGGRFAIDAVSGVITVADGTLLDFETAASHDITVQVTDQDGLSFDKTFAVAVTNANEAPVAVNDQVPTPVDENTSLVFAASGLLANDSDPDGDALTVTSVDNAVHGTVSLDDNGMITFTPDADFSGIAQFDYTVSDGNGETSIATATVDVAPVTHAPSLSIQSLVGSQKTGGEFLINTTTRGGQFQPSIATLANGGFVVTWTDTSRSGDDYNDAIRAQIFDASGNKSGDEFLVNTTIDSAQRKPQTTALTNGGFVVVWQGDGGHGDDTSETSVNAQVFDVKGNKVGNEFQVNTTTDGTQDLPSTTALSNGRFVVTWEDFSGQAGDTDGASIKAQIYEADGRRVGDEFLVNTSTGGDQVTPAITALANGRFVVTWEDFSQTGGDTESGSIKAQIYEADGRQVGGEFLVNTATGREQDAPAITALTNGGFVVTWEDFSRTGGDTDSGSIKAQIFNADGAQVGGEFLVNTTTEAAQLAPKITALTTGGFVVVWDDESGGRAPAPALKAQQFDAFGNKLGGEFQINTHAENYATFPSIAALPDGGFIVTWSDSSEQGSDGDGFAVKVQMFTSASSDKNTPIQLHVNAALTDTDPSETLTLTVSGVPAGATLSDGVNSFTAPPSHKALIATAANTSVDISGWNFGSLTVTPPLDFTGDLQLTFTATATNTATLSAGTVSNSASVTQTVDLTVGPTSPNQNHAPVAVADRVAGTEDTPLVIPVATLLGNDTDVDGDQLTVTSVGNASHGTASLANGNITFTPNANFNGVASFDYTVSDGQGGTSTATVTVDVAPVNDAPVAVADRVAGTEDTPLVIPVATLLGNDTDVDGDQLTVTSVGNASHGTVSLDSTTGNVTFTPDANFNGVASFDYTVSDGQGGTSTATVTVDVAPVNDAPVAVADRVAGTEDTPLVIPVATLLGNDTDVDGDQLTVTSVGNASHGTASLANGNITFTPDANFNGVASFDYTVSDGQGGTSTATVTVDVAPVNDAPVAVADRVTTGEDTPLVIPVATLLGNDSDVDGDQLTVTSVGNASHGTASLANGNITFTPDANFNGVATFDYTVDDGHGGTSTATVTVDVGPVNDAPVAVADRVTTGEDTPLVIAAATLTANDSDVDGDQLTVTSVSNASHGTVSLANGNITFTPDAHFSGIAQFDYTVADGHGGTSTATVTVDVTNHAPVAVADHVTTNQDTPLVMTAATLTANDTDVDGDALTVTAVGNANHGTVVLGIDGKITFTPDANFIGAATFDYTVSDGHGGTSTAPVTVDVAPVVVPVNHAPVAAADSVATSQDRPIVIAAAALVANDSDPDGDALTVTAVGNASNGVVSLDPNSGNITFTPDTHFSGSASFRYTVSDGRGGTSPGIVTVNVAPVNDPPVAVADHLVTVEDSRVIIPVAALTANDSDPTATVTAAGNSSHGAVGLSNGIIVFTPDANFSGIASFDYTISNGKGVSTATVTVDVTPVADAPTLISVAPQVDAGVPSGELQVGAIQAFKEQPVITGLKNGNFVVGYEQATFTGIGEVQIFNASGLKIGGQIDVFPEADPRTNPMMQMTTLSNGNFVATWVDQSGTFGNIFQPLKAQVFNADGGKVGGVFQISAQTSNLLANAPSVTGLPNGNFVVTWEEDFIGSPQTFNLKAQIFDATGAAVSNQFLVSPLQLELFARPATTALSNGNFVVTWGTGTASGVRAQIFNASGSKVGNEFQATSTGSKVSITALTDSRFVVTYQTPTSSLKAQIFDAGGNKVGSEFQVNTGPVDNSHPGNPSIAALANGNFVVVYNTGATNQPTLLKAQEFDSSGNKLGGELTINTTAVSSTSIPSVAALANGGFAASWVNSQGFYETRIFPPATPGHVNVPVPLSILSELTDPDGSETLKVTASDMPVGTRLSDGNNTITVTDNHASIDITSWALPNLTITPPLDFSGDLHVTLTATSTDTAILSTGPATNSTSVTQTIDIPIFLDESLSGNTVAENAPPGTVVGSMTADTNAGSVTYSLTDDANGRFAISPNGVITTVGLITGHSSYSITVQTTNVTSGSIVADTFAIDVNNHAPTGAVLDNNTVTVTADNGKVVGKVTGTDPDGDSLVYSLPSSAGGAFAISADGVITVANRDALIQSEMDIVVRTQDSLGAFADTHFTINGTPNRAPDSALLTLFGNALLAHAAHGTLVGVVTGTDPNGDALDYALVDSAGNQIQNGPFEIDLVTGNIFVDNAALLDASAKDIIVRVADTPGAFTDFHFTVPVSGPTNVVLDHTTVREHTADGISVGKVTATMPNGDPATFSFQSSPFDIFAIDPNSGVITVAHQELLDIPSLGTVADFVVRVTDAATGSYTDANLSMEVAPNHAPDTVSVQLINGPVPAHTPNGTIVGQFFAHDPDGDTLSFLQVLSDGTSTEASPFDIDLVTGIIRVADATQLDGRDLEIFVQVADNFGGVTQRAFTVPAADPPLAPNAPIVQAPLSKSSGSSGDDVPEGGGSDVYKFGSSFGQTTINNLTPDGVTAAHGEIDFGAGLSSQNLWFEHKGNDLQIDRIGTQDHITVAGWYGGNAGAQVQSINTADGSKLDAQLQQLVSAMASYSSANPGFDPTASAQAPNDANLQAAIGAAWHH